MHAGHDVREHEGGQPVVERQQQPRGYQRIVRRYGAYLRLLVASLVVGLVVAVGSWWYLKPQEIATTCYEWYQISGAPRPQTDCVLGLGSMEELNASPLTHGRRVIRVWPSTVAVPFYSTMTGSVDWQSAYPAGTYPWGFLRTEGGLWPSALTASVNPSHWLVPAVRNGLIAAGVAYLLLILIVVPARMLKRPD